MELIAKSLRASHVILDQDATSKKRLFEQIGILFENHNQVSRSTVFDALFSREKLGSTALGQGFALPHGRLKGTRDTLCAFVRLASPIPFDAPDGQPVSMLFVVLVPDHATEHHLRMLSEVAQMFSDQDLRAELATVQDAQAAHLLLTAWTPNARRQRSASI